MRHICVIGDSSAAALKAGWVEIAPSHDDTKLTFFASPGESLRALERVGRCLVTNDDAVAASVRADLGRDIGHRPRRLRRDLDRWSRRDACFERRGVRRIPFRGARRSRRRPRAGLPTGLRSDGRSETTQLRCGRAGSAHRRRRRLGAGHLPTDAVRGHRGRRFGLGRRHRRRCGLARRVVRTRGPSGGRRRHVGSPPASGSVPDSAHDQARVLRRRHRARTWCRGRPTSRCGT